MAAIDKIYGSTEQYDEFLEWVRENKPSLERYFYPRDGFMKDYDRPITNFPESEDIWLIRNCPLDFVMARLKVQYTSLFREKKT